MAPQRAQLPAKAAALKYATKRRARLKLFWVATVIRTSYARTLSQLQRIISDWNNDAYIAFFVFLSVISICEMSLQLKFRRAFGKQTHSHCLQKKKKENIFSFFRLHANSPSIFNELGNPGEPDKFFETVILPGARIRACCHAKPLDTFFSLFYISFIARPRRPRISQEFPEKHQRARALITIWSLLRDVACRERSVPCMR